jgi:hypothetical protein
MEYSGWGCSSAVMARPIAMMMATMPSMRSVLLSLAGFKLPAGATLPRANAGLDKRPRLVETRHADPAWGWSGTLR